MALYDVQAGRRTMVKDRFEKAFGGGELVSDREQRQTTGDIASAAQQAIGAQQQGLARVSMAQASGSPLATGGIAAGSAGMAKAAADSAVKSAGEGKKITAALREKRQAQAEAGLERLQSHRKANAQFYLEMATLAPANIGLG